MKIIVTQHTIYTKHTTYPITSVIKLPLSSSFQNNCSLNNNIYGIKNNPNIYDIYDISSMIKPCRAASYLAMHESKRELFYNKSILIANKYRYNGYSIDLEGATNSQIQIKHYKIILLIF